MQERDVPSSAANCSQIISLIQNVRAKSENFHGAVVPYGCAGHIWAKERHITISGVIFTGRMRF